MSKSTKIWLIIATTLILIGCIIFGGVMSKLNWDFSKLSTNKFETNTHKIADDFNNISINTSTADIVFELSDDNTCSIVCYEKAKQKHSIYVQNDTLLLELSQNKNWHDHIEINFSTPKITVFLPEMQYESLNINEYTGDVKIPKNFNFESIDIVASTGDVDISATTLGNTNIKVTTGDVRVENSSAKSLNISVSTGKVEVSNTNVEDDFYVRVSTGKSYLASVNCKNFVSIGDTGDISLENVIATEKFSIERTTGDIEFKSCDAGKIVVKTDTGDVKGNLLTNKIFFTQTDTGKINVTKSTSGGKCEITTDTGDIKITVN